jgi:hypothetical protein
VTALEQALASIKTLQPRGFGPKGNRQALDRLDRWAEIEDRARSQVEDLSKQESAIRLDSRLSDAGKAEKGLELAQTETTNFGWIGREITQTSEAQDRLRALSLDFLTGAKDADKLLEFLREQEVRQHFRNQPEHERQMAFLKAAERLDGETMRAFQTGPGGPWIAGETLQRAEQSYSERRNREAWKNLQSLGVYAEHLNALAMLIARALLSYGAEPRAIEKALSITLGSATEGAESAMEAARG